MTEYIFLGFTAVWVLGLAVAFIVGMIHDYRNKTYDQVSIPDTAAAKKRIIYNIPFIGFGIFLLIARTYIFGRILSTNTFIPGLLFITSSVVQVILGIIELCCKNK